MNNTPRARNAEHAAALELYRLSQTALNRFMNNEKTSSGLSYQTLATMPEYAALLTARDTAQAAVAIRYPKMPAPNAKSKAKT